LELKEGRGQLGNGCVDASVIVRIQRLRSVEVGLNCGGKGAKKRIKVVRSDGPKDLVFQSIRKGKPMNDQNTVRRHLRAAAERPKMDPKRATWLARYARPGQHGCARQAGIDPKSIQGAMRHSQIPTTVDIHAQLVTELQKRASTRTMEMLNERIERARMTASVAVN